MPENSLKNKKILLINTGSIKKRFILQRLKKLGLYTTVVNKEKNWATPYVTDWLLVDTNKHDAVMQKVGEYLKKNQVDGLLTFWEDDVLLTAKLTDAYGFIGMPRQVAQTARNKYLFREFCQKNGIPAPRFMLIDSEKKLKTARWQLNFPVVIKPVYGCSSAYVIKAETAKELKEVYQYLKNNLSAKVESALSEGLEIMVEEYIDGDEVDIDILLQHGKIKFFSISDNFQTQEPFFVETGQSIPTTLPEKTQQALFDLAEETLEKMGAMDGCIHFEAKYSSQNQAIPIEVNLRMGGDEVHPFVKTAWRVDLIEKAVQIACGEYLPKIKKPEEPYKYLAGKYFLPDKSGVLSKIYLVEGDDKPEEAHDFYFFKEVGDTVFLPPSDYEYLGWLTAVGDNHNDARDNLEKAMSQVYFEIVPFSSVSSLGRTKRPSPFRAAALTQSQVKGKAKIERLRYFDKKQQRRLNLGIACNSFTAEDGAVEAELTQVGSNVEKTLNERGYKTTYIDFNQIDKALEILKKGEIDLIFNVAERLNNSSLLEPHIAALFDVFQIPYTGSSPSTLALCIDKIKVKKLLTYHHIPTPKWDYLYEEDDELRSDWRYPLIVKPGNTDNSIGISNDSVVTNKKALYHQIEYVIKELKHPALVEEYLEGDEYDVSVLGNESDDLRVLPLSRTIFDKLPSNYWHICPFESKFKEAEIFKKYLIVQKPPKNVSKKLISLTSEIALDTYNLLDCHDYGRVEVKLDKDHNPYVLELNPNPSINIGDCVPKVASLIGMDYGDFLEEIIGLAIRRYKNKPPYGHLQGSSL